MAFHARYSSPLYIDEAALSSFDSSTDPAKDAKSFLETGYVKVIDSGWGTVVRGREEPREENEDEDEDPNDGGGEAADGCKMYNVGWMKMDVTSGLIEGYKCLEQPAHWDFLYRRPPRIWKP